MKRLLLIASLFLSSNVFAQRQGLIGSSYNDVWDYQSNETGITTPKTDTLDNGTLSLSYNKTVKSNPEVVSYSYFFDKKLICESMCVTFNGDFEKVGFRDYFNKELQYNGNNVWFDFKDNYQITADLTLQKAGVYFLWYFKTKQK